MYGYIYMTIDSTDNSIYIGQHKSSVFDKNYHGSGIIIKNKLRHHKDKIYTFMLQQCDSKELLDELEIQIISKFKEHFPDRCINIAKGGHSFNGEKHKGKKRTIEQKILISQRTKEGMKASGAAEKLSKINKGRKFSEEHCKNMSKATKGKINIGEKNGMYGKVAINAVKVINKETGQIFQSIKECREFYNVTVKVMFRWLNKHINNLYRLDDLKNN